LISEAKLLEKKLMMELSVTPLPQFLDGTSCSHDVEGDEWMDIDGSNEPLQFLPLSHAGGELEALQELQDELYSAPGKWYATYSIFKCYNTNLTWISCKDGHRRHDRVNQCIRYFNEHLPYLIDAYLK
jgi:hypothetical protein